MATVEINLTDTYYGSGATSVGKIDFDIVRTADGIIPKITSVSVKQPSIPNGNIMATYATFAYVYSIGNESGTQFLTAECAGMNTVIRGSGDTYSEVANQNTNNWTAYQSVAFGVANDKISMSFRLRIIGYATVRESSDIDFTLDGIAKYEADYYDDYEIVDYIRASDVVGGDNLAIDIDRVPAFNPHTVTMKWRIGSNTPVTFATKSSSKSFTVDSSAFLAYADQYTTTNNIPIEIIMEEYRSGGDLHRSGHIYIRCYFPDSYAPSLSISVSERDGRDEYVEGISYAAIGIDTTGISGAEVISAEVRVGTYTLFAEKGSAVWQDDTITMKVPGAGNIGISVKVTDSRGLSSTATDEIFVGSYVAPVITITDLFRCSEDGTIKLDGDHATVVFSSSLSTASVATSVVYTLKVRERGGSEWTSYIMPFESDEFIVTNGSYIFPANVNTDFECSVTASVNLGGVVITTESQYKSFSVSFALLDFDKYNRAIGIGKFAEGSSNVSIGVDMDMSDNKITGLTTDTSDDTSAVALSIVKALYPVGCIYVSYNNVCAPQAIIGGTWERISDVMPYYSSDSQFTTSHQLEKKGLTASGYNTVNLYAWRRTA